MFYRYFCKRILSGFVLLDNLLLEALMLDSLRESMIRSLEMMMDMGQKVLLCIGLLQIGSRMTD